MECLMTKHLLVGESVTAMLPGYWSSTLRAKEHVSRLCMLAYTQFYRLLLIWQKSPPPSGLLLAGWWSSRKNSLRNCLARLKLLIDGRVKLRTAVPDCRSAKGPS